MNHTILKVGDNCDNVLYTDKELTSWLTCQQKASEYTASTLQKRANMKFSATAVWLWFMAGYFMAVIARCVGEVMR